MGALLKLLRHEVEENEPVIKVQLGAPALVKDLPTENAFMGTIPILTPERLLADDRRRAHATLLVSGQALRLATSAARLKAGGAGVVSGENGNNGFSSSGGGTGGFLLPALVPLVILTRGEIWACSDDFGAGGASSLVSILIENWTG